MYKIILKDNVEFAAYAQPTDNSFSVLLNGQEEIDTVLAACTVDNLKEITFIERKGVYSVQKDKQYANKYSVQETDKGLILTVYITDINKVALTLEELQKSQKYQDEAIMELASILGGE